MGLGPENLITINIQALGDHLKRYSCGSYIVFKRNRCWNKVAITTRLVKFFFLFIMKYNVYATFFKYMNNSISNHGNLQWYLKFGQNNFIYNKYFIYVWFFILMMLADVIS